MGYKDVYKLYGSEVPFIAEMFQRGNVKSLGQSGKLSTLRIKSLVLALCVSIMREEQIDIEGLHAAIKGRPKILLSGSELAALADLQKLIGRLKLDNPERWSEESLLV